MGQYKVPQNVEAEDHILGPLTFRQFTYALMGFGWAAVCFALLRKVPVLLIVVGFPPTMLLMLLAFYTRDGQNFEQLLIAMVGYFAAAHRRLWVKEDIIETFHVTPTPKAAEITQRNPEVVRSELEKLATLIDSRGWNIPPDVQPDNNPYALPATAHEDRIVAPPPPAPKAPGEATAKDDIFDMQHSPLAQNLAQLLNEAADDVREEAMQQMNTPGKAPAPAPSTSGVTPEQTGDIVKLATQNDDITVSQLQAQATRIVPLPAVERQAMQGGGQ
jgi:PrgI family protein